MLLVFGLGFSAAAAAATRGAAVGSAPVRRPGPELAGVVLYLAFFAVVALGPGLSVLKAALPDDRPQEVAVLLFKLLTMVALPGWLMVRLGCSWRELLGEVATARSWAAGHRRALLIMAVLLLGLQATIGRGPRAIVALEQPAGVILALAPVALLWMTLEAGVTEEFLFRALLQTRAAAWLRSETAGVVVMAPLFGRAHAPGYVLRGAHLMEGMAGAPGPLTAAAYAIVVVSPIGLMFGVLWARTRNLALVVLLHGWTDLLPNLAPFVRTWMGP